MKTYHVTMTIKATHENGSVEFVPVTAKATGETPLIAANKCFLKNKKAFASIPSVTNLEIFEYECVVGGSEPIDDDSNPEDVRVPAGPIISFIVKCFHTFKTCMWVDAIIITIVYGIWYAFQISKGNHLSDTTNVHLMMVIGACILIPTAFSVAYGVMVRILSKSFIVGKNSSFVLNMTAKVITVTLHGMLIFYITMM